ncbi:MAG: transporter substrate binding family protein, partial [Herbaspirillum sp.]|nr:transporter substrate binding family protein [Herbaspirillum sp.]
MQLPFSRRFAASFFLCSLGVIASVSKPAAAAAVKIVEVTAIVEHAALDAVRDGVKDQLKADGFEEGKNLKFAYQSAQGNTGTAAQIAHKFVGDRPD